MWMGQGRVFWGPIPPCPNVSEDRVFHIPDGMNGWRGGRSEGAHCAWRSAQDPHPGGVAAKILGQRGINPDRVYFSDRDRPRPYRRSKL